MPPNLTDRLDPSRSSPTCKGGPFLVRVAGRHLRRQVLLTLLAWCATPLCLSPLVFGQDTPDYFRQNCLSCHTIGGGRLTGPDLKDLSKRQPDRQWLIEFLMNPRAMIASGDSYAKKILEESNNVPMPTPPEITLERAEKLLDLIEAESLLEESQFKKGLQISSAPFTDADRARGRDIFLGPQRLSCIMFIHVFYN